MYQTRPLDRGITVKLLFNVNTSDGIRRFTVRTSFPGGQLLIQSLMASGHVRTCYAWTGPLESPKWTLVWSRGSEDEIVVNDEILSLL